MYVKKLLRKTGVRNSTMEHGHKLSGIWYILRPIIPSFHSLGIFVFLGFSSSQHIVASTTRYNVDPALYHADPVTVLWQAGLDIQ